MSVLVRLTRARSRRRQRGIAMIIVAIGALALIGMAGLALDMGLAYTYRTRLQNALDAAALGGAKMLSLTGSTTQAQTAALADFASNMDPTGLTITVEFSPTLQPFNSGGSNPTYVRVSVSDLPVTMRLVNALPGIGDTMNVGGSAVAGRIPMGGGEVCNALPIAVCAGPNTAPGADDDADCSDGGCFGYPAGATDELELKGDNSALGPGNYGLVELSCGTGAACVRQGMAGGENNCFDPTGSITTEPGVSSGPTSQGLNTRFNIYNGPVGPSEFPPDVVYRNSPVIYHDQYQALVAAGGASWDTTMPPGRLQRRVAVIPVIDCSTPVNGTSTVPLAGAACFFLTRPVQGSGVNSGFIYGQLFSGCPTYGSIPSDPDPDSPFYQVVLFRNWDSTQN